MRLNLLICSLLAIGVLGCEVDEPPSLATGLDIYLPDGASLALDGTPALTNRVGVASAQVHAQPNDLPTAAEVRSTSPAPAAESPTVARFQGGSERAVLRPNEPARRYHLAWVRLSVPQPDGSIVVSQFHRATQGDKYWADAATRVVHADGAVPVATTPSTVGR